MPFFLAHLFSCDITDLRKKLNSLLASHRRERTKVKEGGRSTWFLYPHMKFLQGHVKSPDDEPVTMYYTYVNRVVVVSCDFLAFAFCQYYIKIKIMSICEVDNNILSIHSKYSLKHR